MSVIIEKQSTTVLTKIITDSKVHGDNMGPIYVLSAPNGPHAGPMNLASWDSQQVHDVMHSTFSVFSALELWTKDTGGDVGEDNGSCIHRPCLTNSIQRCTLLHLTDIGRLLTRSKTSHKAHDLALPVPTQAVPNQNKTHTADILWMELL